MTVRVNPEALKYTPYRIIITFEIVTQTMEDMKLNYPNAKIKLVTSPNSIVGVYAGGQIIDAPTLREKAFFNNPMCRRLCKLIPQTDGYDDPNSGLARSRKGSHLGQAKFRKVLSTRPIEYEEVSKEEEARLKKEENDKLKKEENDRLKKEEVRLKKEAEIKLKNEKDRLNKENKQKRRTRDLESDKKSGADTDKLSKKHLRGDFNE